MPEEKATKRLFAGADAFMVTTANTTYRIFINDRDAFETFDSTFTVDWAADWQADIAAASNLLGDHLRIYEVAAETEKVIDAMQAGRNKWTEIRYFIQKAFPGDAVMLRVFGAGAYLKARGNQPRMMEFLDDLHTAATDHATELIGAGYSQDRIDEIETIYNDLVSKNEVQNKARRGRPKLTAQRIATLNAPYVKMMLVNEAAQIIYMRDAARRGQYVYLPRRRKKKPEQ